ncbi:hypothetical protein [uncultured Phascolarctobacterium sp.]|uniref:hypothetical protein n=1 Tax=uncultured Phascolarctobacterium sp. TaxID=512296 RepID=UPI0027D9CD9C|nr:hypothetical protein [uncultured Phascolarctobacterium sp.]
MLKTTLGIVQAGLILGKLFGSLDLLWVWVFIPLYIVILLAAAILGLAYLADRQQYRKLLK